MRVSIYFRSLFLLLLLCINGWTLTFDPAPNLASQYSIYAKGDLQIKGKGQSAEEGWVGSGKDLGQSGWDNFTFHTKIKISGDFYGGHNLVTTQKVYKDSVLVKGAMSGFTPPLFLNPATFNEPTWDTANHYKSIDLTDSVDLNNNLNYTSAVDTTLLPGKYGNVSAVSDNGIITLTAGTYYFNKLTIRSQIKIVKGENEFTRIIVKDEFFTQTYGTKKHNQLIVPDSAYGRVLLYIAGSKVTIEDDVQIDATIFAPRAKLNLESGMRLYGQVFADTIHIQDGFNGAAGGFNPFITSNIKYVVTELPEHQGGAKNLIDSTTDKSYQAVIPINLVTNAADSTAKIRYEVISYTGSTGDIARMTANGDDPWDFTSVKSSGELHFDPDTKFSKNDTIKVNINDDSKNENDEYFTIRLTALTTNVSLGTDAITHIKIIDDDPDNNKPTGIIFNDKLYEDSIGIVGTLYPNDADGSKDTYTYKLIGGADASSFSITGDKLYTTAKLDTEKPQEYANINVQISDQMDSITVPLSLYINPRNDNQCSASRSTFSVAENGQINGQTLRPYLSDADLKQSENRFKYTVTIPPNHNKAPFNVSLNGTSFTYTPNDALEEVIDSFAYTVVDSTTYDGSNGHISPEAWVVITINQVNDNPPVLFDSTLSLYEGETKSIGNLFTDADLNDTHVLQVLGQANPTAGKATIISGNKIQYATTSNDAIEIFSDVVTFSVTDSGGNGTTVQGTLNVTIKPKNDNPPEPTIDTVTVIQGVNPLPINIITVDHGNGIDIDKDLPTNLTDLKILSITGKDATYCDGLTFNGQTITYKVKNNVIIPPAGIIDELDNIIMDPIKGTPPYDSDTNKVASKVVVKIQRNEANKPVAENDLIEVKEGHSTAQLKNGSNNVITNNDSKTVADLDRVEILTASGPFHAKAFTLNSDGKFSYEHDDSENFSDSVQYILFDKAGLTDTAKIIIEILPLNDNPQNVLSQNAIVQEGLSVNVPVLDSPSIENDIDIETKFEMSLKGANGGAKYGIVTPNADGISFDYYQSIDYMGDTLDTVIVLNYDKTDYDNTEYPFHTKEDSIFITIKPRNTEDPTTTDLNITINELEDTVINLSGLIDDLDLPHDTLTLSIKSQTGKAGTAKFDNTAKTITYETDKNVLTEELGDVIVYTITDDADHETDGTINIRVNPINDNIPVAIRDSIDIPVGQPTEVDIMLDNDTDADKNPSIDPRLSDNPIITGPTNPSGITVAKVGDNRSITVYFDENVHNAIYVDSIEYEIEDPVNYDTTVNKATGWLIIRAVVPDDNDPIGVQDRIELLEDGTATSLVGGATSVMDNDKENKVGTNLASVELVDDVDFGVLTLNTNGTFNYKHNDVEEFNDKFTYRVIDALGNKSFETQVIIAIDTLNDKSPVITDDVLTVNEGGSNSVDILANDDDIDILTEWQTTIIVAKPALYGTVTKNADGTFTYQHDGSENPATGTRLDSFFVEVVDYTEYDPTTHPTENKVVVTINPVVDNPPIANDGVFTTIKEGESTDLDISSLYSDADMPNDVLTVEIVNETTPAGSATIAGDIVTYTHNIATEIFTDNIVYKVTDSEGNSDNGTLSITIDPLNDNKPVAVNDTISVRQGTPFTFTVTGNDRDDDVEFDETFLKIIADSITVPTLGEVVQVDDSTFTYTMNIDFEIIEDSTDLDSFYYAVSDSVGYDTVINASEKGMVFIRLLHDEQGYPKTLNDSLSLQENDSVSSVWSIMDNDTMGFAALKTITIVDDVDHGTLVVDPVTGIFTYDHDNEKEEFTDQFIYTLTDMVGNVSNAALVTLHIDTLNDNQVTPQNENVSVDEGLSIDVDVLTTERNTDADILTTLQNALDGVNGGALYGTATITADGILTYTNNGTEGVTADMVVVNITDPVDYDTTVHILKDTVFITVNPVNENFPDGTAPSYTLKEGETLDVIDSALGLLHDATDDDLGVGNSLSAVLVTMPLYHNVATAGEFTINPNGTFTYVHDDSENFSDLIVYDISDGINTTRLTATLSIEPVNDNAPVAQHDNYIGIEGGTISPITSVLANDSDIDLYLDGMGGTITTPLHAVIEPLQLPTQGTVTMTHDGLFTYTHNGSETVNDSFAYIVIDTMQGITFTDTGKVFISIPQVAPVADSAFYYDEDGNGIVEEIIVHFNDSIDAAATIFSAVWDEDVAAVTLLSATNVGTNGTAVSLTVDGSPQHRTSGALTVTITHGAQFDNLMASIKAKDKAAPTITAATYYYDETAQGNDSLRVFFSENVASFIGNPYNYLDVTTGAEFSMEISQQSHVGSVVTYSVLSKTIKHVNSGDSIQINIANIVPDTLENYQDLTIWAPITLEGKYPQELELLVVPQPMLFVKVTDKKSEAAPLDVKMMEYYNFPSNVPTKGVAFILTGKVPLGDIALQQGSYTILDQPGNIVQEARPMTFTISEESKVTGVAVWEGKNRNGRTVAKSSYLCLVEVKVVTENGEIITKEFKKPIATYGNYE